MTVEDMSGYRLTQYAHGGGCACKIPPGELESMIAGPDTAVLPDERLLVGCETGDDAAAVRLSGNAAVVSTVDFVTPVVDAPYDWGRVAAANALSDVYAMGARPVLAVNVLCWPREALPMELAREVLRGGADVGLEAGCPVAGGHSVDAPEPKYGMAVTGTGEAESLLRNDSGRAGTPLSLSKPLGLGVLNARHKATGEVFPQAVQTMTALNAEASRDALARGVRCATDVTGFGLLGHLVKLCRASGVSAVVDAESVPCLEGAREALRDGYVSGGTWRNLEWVRPHVELSATSDEEALLLADAQTSGGLLVAGELPNAPVIGELIPRDDHVVTVR